MSEAQATLGKTKEFRLYTERIKIIEKHYICRLIREGTV